DYALCDDFRRALQGRQRPECAVGVPLRLIERGDIDSRYFRSLDEEGRFSQPSSRAFWKRRRTSMSTSSPSPSTMRSRKGAMGSGLQQLVPPAKMSGTRSGLSAERSGMPAMSSMSSTVQYAIS